MHHERLDGSGYHRGSSAAQLPSRARLLAAADVWTARRRGSRPRTRSCARNASATATGSKPARFASLTVPVLAGSDSAPFLQASTQAVAAALPRVTVVTLAGQGHIAIDTVPERFAADVLGFLAAGTP